MKLDCQRIQTRRRQRGILQVDLFVGMAILSLAIIPLAYSFSRERASLKIEYQRSVINELVDGEMEILAAGAGQNLPDGTQNLSVETQARLPAGKFQLTKQGQQLRLTWLPLEKCGISSVVREATLK